MAFLLRAGFRNPCWFAMKQHKRPLVVYMCIIIYDVICINLGVIHIQHSCSDLRPSHGKTRFQALCAGFVHSSWQVFLGFGWNTSNDATQIQASKQDCKVSRASYLGSIFGTDCHCRRDIIERPREPIFGCTPQCPFAERAEAIGGCQRCLRARRSPCKQTVGRSREITQRPKHHSDQQLITTHPREWHRVSAFSEQCAIGCDLHRSRFDLCWTWSGQVSRCRFGHAGMGWRQPKLYHCFDTRKPETSQRFLSS